MDVWNNNDDDPGVTEFSDWEAWILIPGVCFVLAMAVIGMAASIKFIGIWLGLL